MKIVNKKRFITFILICLLATYGVLCGLSKLVPGMFDPMGVDWTCEEWTNAN